MATVLVVDDSEIDRCLAGAFLEELPGFTVLYAEDGKEALTIIRREQLDLVLTDMQMPEINGLQLVETIRRDFAGLPVILMTAHGSEEIAVAALRKGAASYVPKRDLTRDLAETVENILSVSRAIRNQHEVLDCLADVQYRYVLANDVSRVATVIGHMQDQMIQLKIVDKSGLIRVGTALFEVLVNAIEHGNLELRSELREIDDRKSYARLGERRRALQPYRDRHVYVTASFSRTEAVYVVRDEGPGFDPSRLPDPTDLTNLDRAGGRGLLLVRTFMDEVTFNATGNQVTMVKRRNGSAPTFPPLRRGGGGVKNG